MKKIECTCIIDDDPIFLYGTARVMKAVDFCDKITVFNNGQEAIDGLSEMVRQNQELPNVIFVDLDMPVMSGWEFLEDFVKIPNQNRGAVNVYIISSSVDPNSLECVKTHKVVNNYILKPMSIKGWEDILNQIK